MKRESTTQSSYWTQEKVRIWTKRIFSHFDFKIILTIRLNSGFVGLQLMSASMLPDDRPAIEDNDDICEWDD